MQLLLVFLIASCVLGMRAASPAANRRTWPLLAMSFVLAIAFLNLRFL